MGTMSGVLSTFFDFLFSIRRVAATACLWLPTALLIYLSPGCNQTVSEPYYLILDRAVKEYFLPEGDREQALELLMQGCQQASNYPDLLCYNAGILLLRENRNQEALEFFRKAISHHDIPLYRSAAERARASDNRSDDYLIQSRKLMAACSNRDPEGLSLLRRALSSENVAMARFASQPLFEQCAEGLADARELAEIRTTMAGIRNSMPDYSREMKALDWQRHPLNRVWNPFWKYGQSAGDRPAVQAWAATLDAARSGSSARTAAEAQKFFAVVRDLGGDQGVALRRAGALLILQDPFFDGVRSDGLKSLAQSNL